MKKISLIILTAILCLSLSGCIWIRVYEKNDTARDASKISKIEFYDIDDNVGLYPKYAIPSSEPSIDELDKHYSPKYELPEYRYEAFISDLDDVYFKRIYVGLFEENERTPKNYTGITVKITYSDGSFEVLSRDAQIFYGKNGTYEYLNQCTERRWNKFISEYYTA